MLGISAGKSFVFRVFKPRQRIWPIVRITASGDFNLGRSLLLSLLLPHRVVEAVRPAGLHQLLGADHTEFAVGYVA